MQIDPNLNAKVESIVKANSDGEASDNVSIYIGYSLLGLGFLNGITDVPDAFIIGASISGFCFAMIDIITLDGTYKRFIKPLTITGIICLFLLPIILTVYPYPLLIDFFSIYSDMGTFVLDKQLRGVFLFMKQDLLELIEKLSENEIVYLYEFANKLFS